jgi:hypothetical protein
MGSFETSDAHSQRLHRPLRVPTRKEHIYREAKELIECMSGWELVSEDQAAGLLNCRKRGSFLSGTAAITISVEGSEEHPTTTVNVRSSPRRGLLSRDKAIVTEFMIPFTRRVV